MSAYKVILLILTCTAVGGCTVTDKASGEKADDRRWLAGDHHIHSRFSVGWDKTETPPKPVLGGDAIYPTAMNAAMGRYFGLSWMVTTDHGGPGHSKVNREWAYPELLQSRKVVPEVMQFYGMELNAPGADHSSLIIPHTHDESDLLFRLESQWDKAEAYPRDPARDTEDKMVAALGVMQNLQEKPVVIANHPSRSATDYGVYGLDSPAEFRRWNDIAPDVAVGMAGAPGHQAFALSNSPRIEDDSIRRRGYYMTFPTLGGFDQMTAMLGGFWDSMLGEGRHWWITINSDSHRNYREGGVDFWPGEYSKTYVYARRTHNAVLGSLRSGHVFVTTGDLVSELYLDVSQGSSRGAIGDEINLAAGEVRVRIRLRDPNGLNGGGFNPEVARVDLITGLIQPGKVEPETNSNDSTRVVKRFFPDDWHRELDFLTMEMRLDLTQSTYLRVRGTNTRELEPEQDPPAEDPWQDLWFYSNPVFVIIDGI